jgi:hypothetical protein
MKSLKEQTNSEGSRPRSVPSDNNFIRPNNTPSFNILMDRAYSHGESTHESSSTGRRTTPVMIVGDIITHLYLQSPTQLCGIYEGVPVLVDDMQGAIEFPNPITGKTRELRIGSQKETPQCIWDEPNYQRLHRRHYESSRLDGSGYCYTSLAKEESDRYQLSRLGCYVSFDTFIRHPLAIKMYKENRLYTKFSIISSSSSNNIVHIEAGSGEFKTHDLFLLRYPVLMQWIMGADSDNVIANWYASKKDRTISQAVKEISDRKTEMETLLSMNQRGEHDDSLTSVDLEANLAPPKCTKCGLLCCCCALTLGAIAVASTDMTPTTGKTPKIEEGLDDTANDIAHYLSAATSLFLSGSDFENALDRTGATTAEQFAHSLKTDADIARISRHASRRVALRRISILVQTAAYTRMRFGNAIAERFGFDIAESLSSTFNSFFSDPDAIPIVAKQEDKSSIPVEPSSAGEALFQTVAVLDSINEASMSAGWEHLTKIVAGMVTLGTVGTNFSEEGFAGVQKGMSTMMASKSFSSLSGAIDGLKYFCNIILDNAFPEVTERFQTGLAEIDKVRDRAVVMLNALNKSKTIPPGDSVIAMMGQLSSASNSVTRLVGVTKEANNRARLLMSQKHITELLTGISAFLNSQNIRMIPFLHSVLLALELESQPLQMCCRMLLTSVNLTW